jgi:hypothetical protein
MMDQLKYLSSTFVHQHVSIAVMIIRVTEKNIRNPNKFVTIQFLQIISQTYLVTDWQFYHPLKLY